MGVGGVLLALLRSIIDGTRRTALQLMASCIFGGLGAAAAGFVWAESHYVYFICGIAAVVTDNVVVGLFAFSKQFATDPRDWMSWVLKTVVTVVPIFPAFKSAAAIKSLADAGDAEKVAAAMVDAEVKLKS